MKILTLAPRKPIIYPPGIISLILLPIFCLVYLNKHKVFEQQSWMDIAMWSPDLAKIYSSKYSKGYPPDRKFLTINLDGNNGNDKTRLDFARLEIRRILTSEDTINGVDFHFGKKAQYWTFITALDILETEKAQVYSPYRDDIHVWFKKVHNVSRLSLYNDVITEPPTPEEINRKLWNTRIEFINTAVKDFWVPGLVFLIMIYFTFKKLYQNLYRS